MSYAALALDIGMLDGGMLDGGMLDGGMLDGGIPCGVGDRVTAR